MGNRAVITFESHPKIGIYLHWNGGVESVLAFIEATKQRNSRPPGDSYAVARLTQTIGDFFGHEGLSLGVDAIETLDCDNGDNGLYVIADDWSIVKRRYANDTRRTYANLSPDSQETHDAILERLNQYRDGRLSLEKTLDEADSDAA